MQPVRAHSQCLIRLSRRVVRRVVSPLWPDRRQSLGHAPQSPPGSGRDRIALPQTPKRQKEKTNGRLADKQLLQFSILKKEERAPAELQNNLQRPEFAARPLARAQ